MPSRFARAGFADRLANVWNEAFDERVELLRSLPRGHRMSISNQLLLFNSDDFVVNDDVLQRLYAASPKLPPIIRYYDDLDDKLRSIAEPVKQFLFELHLSALRRASIFRASTLGPNCFLSIYSYSSSAPIAVWARRFCTLRGRIHYSMSIYVRWSRQDKD